MTYRSTFKKGKFSSQINSKSKIETQTQKDYPFSNDEKNWIGEISQSQTKSIHHLHYNHNNIHSNQIIDNQYLQKNYHQSINKSPTQLIQDILKGLNINEDTHLSPFYTKNSEETIIDLLTNRNKLANFIKSLQTNMSGLDKQVVRNYEVLILLLKEVHSNDVEVKQTQQGLEIKFNRSTMQKQQDQIARLQKQLSQRDNHMKEIIEGYQAIIRNFNEVIEKLIDQKNQKGTKNIYHI